MQTPSGLHLPRGVGDRVVKCNYKVELDVAKNGMHFFVIPQGCPCDFCKMIHKGIVEPYQKAQAEMAAKQKEAQPNAGLS